MLGDRLRELRVNHQLTLRALAAESGVSAGLLSQLENGRTNPSLATLRKLADVFDSEVSALFSEPAAPTVVLTRPGERMRLTAPAGRISYERLTPGRGDLEVLLATIQPGDVSASEPRGHPSTECVVVVEGEVLVEAGEETYPLSTYESLTLDSRIPHRFCNVSDRPSTYLIAVTPPTP